MTGINGNWADIHTFTLHNESEPSNWVVRLWITAVHYIFMLLSSECAQHWGYSALVLAPHSALQLRSKSLHSYMLVEIILKCWSFCEFELSSLLQNLLLVFHSFCDDDQWKSKLRLVTSTHSVGLHHRSRRTSCFAICFEKIYNVPKFSLQGDVLFAILCCERVYKGGLPFYPWRSEVIPHGSVPESLLVTIQVTFLCL